MTAAIGPFSAITAGLNCSFAGKLAFAQPPMKIVNEKHSPLYSFYNGGAGEITINLDKDLMNAVSGVIPLDQTPPGRLAHIAYRLFSKLELEVETNDVETLPDVLKSAINGDVLKTVFDFWNQAAQKF